MDGELKEKELDIAEDKAPETEPVKKRSLFVRIFALTLVLIYLVLVGIFIYFCATGSGFIFPMLFVLVIYPMVIYLILWLKRVGDKMGK